MEKATREHLAKAAKDMALIPFHGDIDGKASNLAPIVQLFPTWNVKEAGFEIPYRPAECKFCHLAACFGWEEFAAEGNVNNISAIIERPIDDHIRAYIRIPDGYRYSDK